MKGSCFRYLFLLHFCILQLGHGRNVTGRPSVLNIGAILSFESTIGRVAKIAIDEAVKDVNADHNILPGTQLVVTMQDSNCSGFLGMVQAMQFMKNDVVAIIGPQCSVVAHIVTHVASELQVPLLSFGATDPALSPIQYPFFVRSTQSDSYQMAAVAQIIDHYTWREVIAIFIDDDYGRNGLAELSDKLAEKRCRISYKAGIQPLSVASRSEIMDILVKVALMESRIIVLHVNPAIGKDVFSVANYLGMMVNGYVWIATDWLASYLDSASPLPSGFMDSIQGVLVLRQHTPDSDKKTAFLARWNKKTGGSLGLNSYGLYAYDSVWLFAHAMNSFFNQGGVISFSNDSRITLAAGNLHLGGMSIFDGGHLLLKSILDSNFVGLSGPVKFSSDRSLSFPAYDVVNVVGTGVRRIGYWSNYSGLSTVPPETLYSKPPNRSSSSQQLYSVIWPGETSSKPRGWAFSSNGKQLRVAVPNRVSFKEFVSKVRGTDNFQGFCIDVFSAAMNLLPYGVPYKFVGYGDGKKNPNYDALVNSITTGELDAVVGDIAIVKNRTKMVDFTQPYAASGLVVVAPFHKSNIGAWAFLRPFSWQMWIANASSFLVIGIVVWILEHRLNDEFRGSPRQQAVTVLWFSFSTLFFSHRETTVGSLGRFVLIIWLFVVLIINSSYTASLTSILTVQQLSSPIKGIETLKTSNVRIGYQVGSFAERYLSEEFNISKSRLVPLGSPEEYAVALKLGPHKEGGVAAVVDELPYIEIFLSRQCTFRIVGQQFSKSSWGFAFPRDSPLADDVSTAILALAENGDLQRIHDKWLMQSRCSSEENEIESDRLELKSFWGLFLVSGIVCFLALFMYFLHLLRQLRRLPMAEPDSSPTSGERRSSSSSIHRLLSLMDERKQRSNKRRKVEKSECDGIDRDTEVGKSKKRAMDCEGNCV